eukprot:scaffold177862_cov32-Tisochrysis_lutea.AAC.1
MTAVGPKAPRREAGAQFSPLASPTNRWNASAARGSAIAHAVTVTRCPGRSASAAACLLFSAICWMPTHLNRRSNRRHISIAPAAGKARIAGRASAIAPPSLSFPQHAAVSSRAPFPSSPLSSYG